MAHAIAMEPKPKPPVELLIAIAAVSPLGINMYLPSLPGMARALNVDFATVQLTLALYLAAMALGQLIVGPLSDRYGRRPILLIGLGIFVFGSFMCLIAQNVELLIVGRIVQALGGCAGVPLSRAIVRDLYRRNEVASMIGYVTMGMAVAPMLAPSIGGMLDAYFGWRACFAILAGFAGVVLLFASQQLYETRYNSGSEGSVRVFLRGYSILLRSRLFWGYALLVSSISAMFFALMAGTPYVMIDLMKYNPTEYGLYFAALPAGYLLGNFATGRLAGRVGPNRLILMGVVMSVVSVGGMASAFAMHLLHPISLCGPMLFVGIANGLVLPNALAGVVSVKPEVSGAAAGLAGSLQMGLGAIVAPIVGATLKTTAWPLISIMSACVLLALAAFALIRDQHPYRR